jgi:histone-arginine methyltransferase CARM1
MDVGTGSGILAIFAALGGSKKVYAVEASDAIRYADVLIRYHNLNEKIVLINKKIEEIQKNEIGQVDVIISEPLGVMLLNERMLESFLVARDKLVLYIIT